MTENNNKYSQKPKNQKKSARRKGRCHSNPKVFSENFIYDTLKVFFKPMGAIDFRIM